MGWRNLCDVPGAIRPKFHQARSAITVCRYHVFMLIVVVRGVVEPGAPNTRQLWVLAGLIQYRDRSEGNERTDRRGFQEQGCMRERVYRRAQSDAGGRHCVEERNRHVEPTGEQKTVPIETQQSTLLKPGFPVNLQTMRTREKCLQCGIDLVCLE